MLRCVFWLSIVYAAILSHGTFRFDGQAFGAAEIARRQVSQALETAAAGATRTCARRIGECVKDADHLVALFGGAAMPRAADLRRVVGGDAPLPPMRPRRRDAKLTRTP